MTSERDPQNLPKPIALDRATARAALALAQAMIPPGAVIPGASERTVRDAAAFSAEMSGGSPALFRALVTILDWRATLSTGRPFHRLSHDAQEALLEKWTTAPVMRWPLFALGGIIKSAHFDNAEVYAAYGQDYVKGGPPEPARWLQQVQSADSWEDDEPIECDVVVVGTGAGGAVVGKELAEQGHAVVFVEEGSMYRRDAFRGSIQEAHRKFYRGHAKVVSIGNTVIPILMGRLVGGSTAINTGTSFRTPTWILDEWCERMGTDALTWDHMERHFQKVERQIDVGPNDEKVIGPMGRIVARGCDRLGWSHFRVPRNAPDCDGQACCDLGCPSGARKSMDITYLPKALSRGAMLLTEARATRVLLEGGRAVGVEARSTGQGRALKVRARAVVLAGGAVPTPHLLLGQGIANRSGQVGRNLSIHPGSAISALFDEPINGFKHVPQGVGCDQFHREGFLLLAANPPISVAPNYFPFYGRKLTIAMDSLGHLASMGVLVRDATQNGRVRAGFGGEPLISYWLQPRDLELMHLGVVRIVELFWAAGSRRIFPLGHRMPVIESAAALERFRGRRISPSDYVWTAFHPLGTVRMGQDPATSVVDLDHQCHDVPGLFVVDGSTVPGPTAVNPQLTIMAMADRAAERIGEFL